MTEKKSLSKEKTKHPCDHRISCCAVQADVLYSMIKLRDLFLKISMLTEEVESEKIYDFDHSFMSFNLFDRDGTRG